jgi:hypothetical protein
MAQDYNADFKSKYLIALYAERDKLLLQKQHFPISFQLLEDEIQRNSPKDAPTSESQPVSNIIVKLQEKVRVPVDMYPEVKSKVIQKEINLIITSK